ncbi:MAG TPA: hypothetical protein VFE54_08110, partial [Mucilaginibacter sp.]|nr:hypothetical protein [Mucilaginibacter sp.]
MKKAVFLLAMVTIIFFSCKKDHFTSTPAAKKYRVAFNVANFTSRQSNLAIRHGARSLADTVNASGAIDILYYAVYSGGIGVHGVITKQDSSMANFGTVIDSLPAGQYQVVFIGGKKGLIDTYTGRTAADNFHYGSTKWQDTFWDEFVMTVGNGNISQDVTLKRVVGKLELDITDNIPANADSLVITVDPEATNFMNDGGMPSPPGGTVTYSEKIPAGAIGHSNFTMDRIIGNIAVPATVTIICKDSGNQTIASATASNVTIQANTKTVLSGNLFATSPA